MPTENEIEHGRAKVLGGILSQITENDYPAYVAGQKQSIKLIPDTSPSVQTNNLIKPVYTLLHSVISEFDWQQAVSSSVVTYKGIGDKCMDNIAFYAVIEMAYRFFITAYLPKPEKASLADSAYIAHQVLADRFEILYHKKVRVNQLWNYADAIKKELASISIDPVEVQKESRLYQRFGIGLDRMFIFVDPFDTFHALWDA